MKLLEDNSNLPECLNTSEKQTKQASLLAEKHFGLRTKQVTEPDTQGFWSRTKIVELANAEQVVVQFRYEESLDLKPFRLARALLGDTVPNIEEIEDGALLEIGIQSYLMNRMPGRIWRDVIAASEPRVRIIANASLGKIMSKGQEFVRLLRQES